MISRIIQCSAGLAVSVLLLSVTPGYAAPVSYSTGGASQTGIGWDGVYGDNTYDILKLAAYSDTFTGPGTIKLNPVEFIVGVNSNISASYTGSISETLTIDGDTHTIAIPYSISISSSDLLTITGGPEFLFTGWKVVLQELVLGPSGGGSTYATLYATVSELASQSAVPLPPALLLFGSALVGLITLGRRRRQGAAV